MSLERVPSQPPRSATTATSATSLCILKAELRLQVRAHAKPSNLTRFKSLSSYSIARSLNCAKQAIGWVGLAGLIVHCFIVLHKRRLQLMALITIGPRHYLDLLHVTRRYTGCENRNVCKNGTVQITKKKKVTA